MTFHYNTQRSEMKARFFCFLLTLIIILLLSTTAQAAEYREVAKKVNASDILIHVEMGEDINLDNCSIVGELNASKIKTVPNPLYYHSVRVDGNNNLFISSGHREPLHVIESNITIRNTFFENSVDLSYVFFKNSADFEGSTFNKSVDFEESVFNTANFARLTFNNSVNFGGSTFNSSVDFLQSTFNDSTTFVESTFNDSAFFGGAVFNNSLNSPDFRESTFNDLAYFGGAIFKGHAHFVWAIFNNSADFAGATFDNSSDFKQSTFNDSASFFGTIFNNSVTFEGSIFNNSADFTGATFKDNANFEKSKFNNVVYFRESTFNNSVNLGDSTFNNSVYFEDSTFKDAAYFGGSIFKNSVDFWGVTFSNSADFVAPETSETIFTDGKTCEFFRKSYDSYARYTDADNVYYNYRITWMEGKSISISKLIDILSWVTCGFGIKLEYTIGWIFGIVIFFAFVYKWDWKTSGIYRVSEEDKTEKSNVSFWECLCFSINTFTTLGSPNWSHRDKFWYVVTIEGVLGWVMLAIFLATLIHLLIRP